MRNTVLLVIPLLINFLSELQQYGHHKADHKNKDMQNQWFAQLHYGAFAQE